MGEVQRKKPIIVEVKQYSNDNKEEVLEWLGDKGYYQNNNLYVKTLEGVLKADEGDFIIKGIKGEFYPCKPDVFKETYIPV